MKKRILGILVTLIILASLLGCSNSFEANAKSDNQSEPIIKSLPNVDIGEKIAEEGSYKVYYVGLSGDSVIINIFHDKPEYESSFILNIPTNRTQPVKLPFIKNTSIKIINVKGHTGEVYFKIIK